MKSFLSLALATLVARASAELVNGIYYDEWHTQNIPGPNVTAGINHVYIAFVNPQALNTVPMGNTSTFTTVAEMKKKFGNNTKVLLAVGGWGFFFNESSTNETQRKIFAKNVGTVLKQTGADGVDIDWEFPGGNGVDYKIIPNSAKTSEIVTFPQLLAAIRAEIGPKKLLTIAVPGRVSDMIAYTKKTVPEIAAIVDYFHLMAYDLMNRRDTLTNHHTSVDGSLQMVNNYLALGLPPSKTILGFAYYAKWFTTKANSTCATNPIGCEAAVMEDALGNDLGNSGATTFEPANMVAVTVPANLTVDPNGSCGGSTSFTCQKGGANACCSQWGFCGDTTGHCGTGCQVNFGDCTAGGKRTLQDSWQLALKDGKADEKLGGQYYFDTELNIFWTWDTPEFIAQKFTKIVEAKRLAGVMAWGLGLDTYDNKLMKAVQQGVDGVNAKLPKSKRYSRVKRIS